MIKRIKVSRKKQNYKKWQTRKRNVQRGGVDEITCINVLGEGSYGIVFMAESRNAGLIAVKFLKYIKSNSAERSRQLKVHQNELAIYDMLKDLNSENILKSIDLTDTKIIVADTYKLNRSEPAIATELCDFDLYSLIVGSVTIDDMNIYGTTYKFLPKVYGMPNETVIYYIASQIFNGLYALYNKKIIHCDIKPENIFVKREPGNKYTFKIGDFGFAAKHEQFPLEKTYNNRYFKNTQELYQNWTYNYAIHTDLYIYNTYMKDLTAYALTLYVLENRNLCNINAEHMTISKLLDPDKSITKIISILSRLEHKIITLPTLHNNYAKDTEMYKEAYEALSKLFDDWKTKQVSVNTDLPISIIPKINSQSENNDSLIITNKYATGKGIKNIINDIGKHYKLTLEKSETYIDKGAKYEWADKFLDMCKKKS